MKYTLLMCAIVVVHGVRRKETEVMHRRIDALVDRFKSNLDSLQETIDLESKSRYETDVLLNATVRSLTESFVSFGNISKISKQYELFNQLRLQIARSGVQANENTGALRQFRNHVDSLLTNLKQAFKKEKKQERRVQRDVELMQSRVNRLETVSEKNCDALLEISQTLKQFSADNNVFRESMTSLIQRAVPSGMCGR